MAFVRRANVVLEVNDDAIERMLDTGFCVIDEHGNVIREGVPKDVATLTNFYIEHTHAIEALKKEVAELKIELEKAKSAKARKSTKQTQNK